MKKILLLFVLLAPSFLYAQTDSLALLQSTVSVEENRAETQPVLTWKDRRDPFAAGLLSYLMPGLGQVYNKQYEKAFGIAAVIASSVVMGGRYARMGDEELSAAVFCLGIGGAWAFSFIDAISTASKFNKSIQLGRNTSMSLKPDLDFHPNPIISGHSKSGPLLGLKLSVSL